MVLISQEVHHSWEFVRDTKTMVRTSIVLALSVIAATSIQAGPFGLFRRGGNYTNTGTNNNVTYNRPVANAFLGTAQGVANHLASLGRGVFHMGGNPYAYEGVGMGATPQAAIQNCCFYGKRPLRDSGVAQGSNGMWYACCRYN